MNFVISMLGILVGILCFAAGWYIRDLICKGKEVSFKQVKKDLGIKSKGFVSSPSAKQKASDVINGFPKEE